MVTSTLVSQTEDVLVRRLTWQSGGQLAGVTVVIGAHSGRQVEDLGAGQLGRHR